MRKFLIALLVLQMPVVLLAQHKSLLYDFYEIPQSTLLNPGVRTSYQWFAGVPGASGVSIQAGTSGISVNDIFAEDGLDINAKIRDRAVYGLTSRDDISSTIQLELLSGGFRDPNRDDTFYSFGWYIEQDFINYWPRDLAVLAWEGNAGRFGERFRLSHLKTRGEANSVFHFGLNRQLNRQLTVGARAKIYSGIYHFSSTQNRGYFLTQEGVNNLVSNTLVADMRMQTSGVNALENGADSDTGLSSAFMKRALFGGDLGLGLDLGFTWAVNQQLLITGSLLDVGLMMHSGDVRTFALKGRATVEGVEVILPQALADPNADFWQDLVEDIEGLIPFEEENNSYVSFRPTKLYGSVRYDFGEPTGGGGQQSCDCDVNSNSGAQLINSYRNAVGGQVFLINRPRGPQAAITGFYLRRIGNFLALKGTYTADKYNLANLGLGLNVQAGPLQFYVLADNLLGYRNIVDSHYASVQFGLNILSWGSN